MKNLYQTFRTSRAALMLLLMGIMLLVASTVSAQQVTVFTDKDDYWPGEWVIITGYGWVEENSVQITLVHIEPNIPEHAHDPFYIIPNDTGGIYYEWFVFDEELGTSFRLEALGIPTGNYDETFFTDGQQTPTISSVSPSSGTYLGETSVTINGSAYASQYNISVTFGGVSATNVTRTSNNTVTATTPAHILGFVDVTITVGSLSATLSNGYEYTGCVPPDVPTVSASEEIICDGTSSTLSIISGDLNSATAWHWYTGTCGGTVVGTGNSIDVSPTTTTTYYVRGEGDCVTPGSCGSITITVNPLPTATISYDGSPYCATGTAAVTQIGQSGGTYSSTAGLSINSSTGEIDLEASTPATYTVTYDFTDGTCSNSTTADVTINALSTATISYDGSPYCANGTAAVTHSGQSGGTYSSTAGLSINSSTGEIDLEASTPATYIVTYNFTDGTCSNSTTADVTINALPTVDITGNTSICIGGTSYLSPTAGGTWVSSDNGIATITPEGAVTGISAGSATFTFTETSTGCSNTTAAVTVEEDPAIPTATKSPDVATVCVGQTLTLTDITDNGGGTGTCEIQYSYNSGSGFTGWSTTLPGFSAGLGQTNSIRIRKVCDGSGCGASDFNEYTWTVNEIPNNSIFTGGTICNGETGTLTFDALNVSFVAPYTIEYTDGVTIWSQVISGASSTTFDVAVDPIVTTPYSLVSITNGNGCTRTTGFGDATAEITVQSIPTLNINDVSVSEADGTAQFTVTLSDDVVCDVTFDVATADNSANTGSDYAVITTAQYTIEAGEISTTIEVDITNDAVTEPTESFYINISNPAFATISKAIGVGSITDDDASTLTIDDMEVDEDAGNAIFTVTLDKPVQNAFSVNYSTNDDSAIQPGDYTLTSGTLTFGAANDLVQYITVPIINDAATVEPTENYTVDLSGLVANSQAVTVDDAQGLGTINDLTTATIVINDMEVDEDAGNAIFTVTLDKPVQNAFSVNYSTNDDSAIQPGDYTLTSGTLTFGAANDLVQYITVPIINDAATVEPTENYTVDLSGLVANSQAVTVDDAQGLGTINDLTTATIVINDMEVDEDAGNAIFTVTLDKPVQNAFSVNYSTNDDSAIQPGDYTLTSGTLTFGAANDLVQYITVPIINDAATVEPTENYTVDLSGLVANSQAVTVDDAQGLGTINDLTTATIVINDMEVDEDAGNAIFTVTLDKPVQNAFSVNYSTNDDSAIQPGDYTLTSGTLTFGAANDLVQYITVPIINDAATVEPTENYTVDLSGLVANSQAVTVDDAQGLGTINDLTTATIVINDMEVDEDAGNAIFTVTLDKPVQNAFSVNYSTNDDSAIQPGDYTLTSGTLTFGAANDLVQYITVPIINDAATVEPTENYTVDLSGLVANSQAVTVDDAQGLGTINDLTTATIVINDMEVDEDAGNAIFTVTLDKPVQNAFSVNYSTNDDSAIQPGDYTLTSGTLTFGAANDLVQYITVPIINDAATVEPTENYTVDLSGLVANSQAVTVDDAQGLGTINDLTTATIVINDMEVDEDAGNAIFTVTLDKPVQNAFSVNYSTNDDSAIQPGDYTLTSGTLTFGAANDLVQYITVPIINDAATVEPTENYTVDLSGLVANSQAVTVDDAQGLGTINDLTTATIVINDMEVDEDAGNAIFTVTLDKPVQNAFSVNYSTNDDSAIQPGDYTLTSGTLTFGAANDLVQYITVPIINDAATVEPTENYTVDLSGLVANSQAVTVDDAQGLGTINDLTTATIVINDMEVDEDAGNAIFTVTLDKPVQNAFSVNYSTNDDSAIQPGDYTLNSGTLTFGAANDLVQYITVPIINDAATVEPTENYTVDLSGLVANSQAVTVDDAQGLGTINDLTTATIVINDMEVDEDAGNAIFTVTLDKPVQNAFSVNYSTNDDSAIQPGDYTLTSGTLTFGAANDLVQYITVPIINDAATVEPTENYTVDLSGLVANSQAVTVDDAQGLGTINDLTTATIVINDMEVDEDAGNAIFTVTLDKPVQNAFSVNYSTNDDSAIQPGDYTLTSGTLTFGAANDLVQYITVPIINDAATVEPTENYTVDLSGLVANSQAVTVDDAQGLGTINDLTTATIVINDMEVDEDAGNAIFTVTLDKPVQNAFSVNYSTNDDSAIQPGDYTLTSGTLTFGAANDLVQYITVPIINDAATVEPTENYTVDLSGLVANSQAVTVDDAQGLGTINDLTTATIVINDMEVDEDAGNAIFTVTLDKPVQNAFSVNYSTNDDSAIQPGDYTLTSGTLTFGAANDLVQYITVPIINDAATVEPTENYTVDLSGLVANSQAVTVDDAQGLGTINDLTTATIVINDMEVDEDAGNAIFTVTLDKPVQNAFSVNYSTNDDSAIQPGDYTLTSGTLTFGAANDLVQYITVPIINDAATVEPTENYTVDLSGLVANSQAVTVDDAQGLGTINDLTTATIVINDMEVDEDAGNAIFTVTLDKPVQNAFSVNYSTNDDSAIQPGDYTLTSGTLTFGAANDLVQYITVPIINDAATVEPTENYTVDLSGLVANSQAVTVDDAQGLGTINDLTTATIVINDMEVDEDAGNAIFTVTLDKPVQNAFSVNYSTNDDSAIQPGDYTLTSGTLTFGAANDLVQYITVPIINDAATVEPTENYTVDLSGLVANSQAVTVDDAQGLGTINDLTTATIVINDMEVDEDAGNAIFTVTLDKPVQNAFSVNYSTNDDSAIQPGDYTLTSGTLTFGAANDLVQYITVPIINDAATVEPTENYTVDLSGLVANSQAVTVDDAQGLGTINDLTTATIVINDMEVDEDAGNAIFTVTLDKPVQNAFSVNYSTNDDSAIQPGDYTLTSGTLTFGAANDLVQYITVPIINDAATVEPTENYTVDLSGLVANSQAVTVDDAQGLGTINDLTTATIVINDMEVDEDAGNAIFTVTLDKPVQNAFSVNYSTNDDSAIQPGDYTLTSGTLTFGAANDLVQYITVPIINDAATVEPTENYTVDLSGLVANSQAVTVDDAQGLGTINDLTTATIVINDMEVDEDAGNAIFTVTLDKPVQNAFSVNYSTNDDSAIQPGDYTLTSGTLTFGAANDLVQYITVPIINDAATVEPTENYTVDLSGLVANSQAVTVDDAQGLGTINDLTTATIVINDMEVDEDAGNAIFTVTLDKPVQNAFSVNYSTNDDSAIQPGDYTLTSGTLTFGAANDLVQYITVPIINDAATVEPTENYTVDLSGLVANSQAVTVDDAQGLGTINDLTTATIVINDMEVDEDAGNAIFTVTLDKPVQNAFSVNYSTNDDSAIQPGDYTLTSGTLTFGAANDLVQYITVPIINDAATVEPTENYTVDLSGLVANSQAVTVDDAQGLGTINDLTTATIVINDMEVDEDAGNAIFTVTLDKPVQNAFSVNYSTNDDSAIQPGDYTLTSGTLTFGAANDLVQYITVPIINDAATVEPTENYTVDLSGLVANSQAVTVDDAQGLGTINDLTTATIVINDMEVDEDAGNAIFTVTLDKPVQNAFSVNYSTNDDSAIQPGDYTLTSGTLTFGAANDLVQYITVPIINDAATVEPTENYTVDLSGLVANSQAVTVDDAQGLGTINDLTTATIVINDMEVDEDAGNAIFTVTLDKPVQNAFSVNYSTNDDSAIQPGDYTLTSGTLTFGAANDLVQYITVPIINDAATVEPTENYTVDLSGLVANSQAVTVDDAQGLGTINDLTTATIVINDMEVDEDAGNAIFTVTLDKPVQNAFSVNYSTNDDSAIQPGDYTLTSGTLTFGAANDLVQYITVPIINDAATVEPTENYTVDLSGLVANSQAVTVDDAQGLGTINDLTTATIVINDMEVDEDAGNAIFTVTLDKPVQNAFSVNYSTNDDSAIQPGDYTLTSGTLTFGAANDLVQYITVPIINDAATVEPTENYTVDLSGLVANSQAVTVDDAQGLGTINDLTTATIVINDMEVDEDAGNAIFTVTLDKPVQNAFSVNYSTNDDSAIQPGDYTLTSGTLTFGAANDLVQYITVPIINDAATVEPTENYTVDLSGLVANSQAVTVDDAQGLGTINDLTTATIVINDMEVDEDAGNAIFTVTLDKPVQNAFSVNYSTNDDSAIQPGDYTLTSGTLTFGAANDLVQYITVPIINDAATVEPTENYTVDLSGLVANSQAVTVDDAQGLGTINDLTTATIVINDMEVDEDAGNAIFTVTLDKPVQNAFSVNYSTNDDSAIQPGDYTLTSGTLTFGAANDLVQYITVPIINDAATVEPTENYTVDLSGLVANSQAVTVDDAQGLGTINDLTTATIVINDMEVDEDAGNAIFTVTLDKPVQNAFSVNYSTNDDSAIQPGDYTLTSGTLTFGAANDLVQYITVPIINDAATVEPTENYTVDLSGLVANSQAVTVDDAQGLGTINDLTTATIVINDMEVDEDAGNAIFTVTLDKPVQNAFSVNYSTNDDSAIQPGDYTLTSGTLTFGAANDLVQYITVPIINDAATVEPTENYTVDLSGLVANSQAVTVDDAQGLGTINDLTTATIVINDMEVDEDAGNAIFTVTLDKPVQNAFSVNYSTNDDSAIQPGDYTLTSGTLTFGAANDLVQYITVPIINDAATVEPTENYTVDLSGLVANSQAVTVDDAQGLGTINDLTTATIVINDMEVDEDAGNAIFTVTLDKPVQNAFSVNYSTNDDSAIQPGDYTLNSGTLTFGAANDNTQNIVVDIIDGTVVEPQEKFVVDLSNLQAAGQNVTVTDAQGVGTINDNDEAFLSINDVTVLESEGTATLTVTLTGMVQNDFNVDFATANGTALDPSDYTAQNGTLTFGGTNSNTQNVVFTIANNTAFEPTESFFVNLVNLVTEGQNITFTDNQGEITIIDNDVNLTLDKPIEDFAQYSDQIELQATLTNGNGEALAGQTITFTVGIQSPVTAITDANGVAATTLKLDQNPNLSTNEMVIATFAANTVNSIPYEGRTVSKNFDIVKEDARIDYTGDVIKATASTSTYSAEMTLRANIIDIEDLSRGDITNAKVMFVDREAANAPLSGWLPVTTLVDPSGYIGTVSQSITVSGLTSTTPYKFMTIGIIVDNGYYIRNSMDDDVVITVYTPVDDFITGGGYITVRDESAGTFKPDVGSKVNFGFNVGYKNKKNIGGNMNIILRRTEADGLVHNYQVKANAMVSLGVNASNPASQTAEYLAKANIKDVSGYGTSFFGTGNKDLYVKITDNGEPGENDLISFVLVEMDADPTVQSNILFSSYWENSITEKVNLDGGNTVVHSGFSIGFSTVLTSNKNPSSVGEAVTFTATVYGGESSKTVTFYDEAGVIGSSTLNSSGIATIATSDLTAGSHNITAVYDGTETSDVLVQEVTTGVGVILTSSNNPSVLGDAVTFTATVTGGTPGLSVTFKDGGSTIGSSPLGAGFTATYSKSDLTAGSHNITAVYDDGVTPVTSNVLVQQVVSSNIVVVLTSSNNPSLINESVTFTATVSGGNNGTSVKFYDGGTGGTEFATVNLSNGKAVSPPINSLSAGLHNITAVYDDGNGTTATSSILTQVVSDIFTITLTSSKNPSQVNTSVTFTANVNGTGGSAPNGTTVTFKSNGSIIGSGTVSDGKATLPYTFKSTGTYSITAVYGANQSAELLQQVKNKVKSAEIATSVEPVFELSELKVYPNPFFEKVRFEFKSPESVHAKIDIYDMTGRKVQTVFEGPVEAGVTYSKYFKPETVISGMYFYRMTLGDAVFNGKLIYKKNK